MIENQFDISLVFLFKEEQLNGKDEQNKESTTVRKCTFF